VGAEQGLGQSPAVDRPPLDALTRLSEHAIGDIYDARDFLETEVERRAAPLLGEPALVDMRAALAVQERAITHRDAAAMIAGNRAFHFAVFECCPNSWLIDLVGRLWNVMDPYRVISYGRMWEEAQDELVAGEILVEHHRILNALSRGGEERALYLLRRHPGPRAGLDAAGA
jgi:DNA-binding GntR family transcriptional regulator